MRLWHKDLIFVLPHQQLLDQWRDCCLVAKSLADAPWSLKHVLANRVLDYPLEHFFAYTSLVYMAMLSRGYRADWESFAKYKIPSAPQGIYYRAIFSDWHNTRYLKQCLYNLQEKLDCGAISAEEGKTLFAEFRDLLEPSKRLYAVEYRSYNAEKDVWRSKVSQTGYVTLKDAQAFIESRANCPHAISNFYYQTPAFEEYYIHEITT